MYLLQNAGPVNNRKWNLGRMGRMGCGKCPGRGTLACGSCSGDPVSPLGIESQRSRRMGRLGRLGDAGLPSGSQLTYTASFSVPTVSWSGTSVSNALQAVTSSLGAYAVSVTGKTYSQNGAQVQVAMTLMTQSDRNAPSDVQSIVDALLQQQNAQSLSSQIGVINIATTTPTSPVYVDPNTGIATPAPQSASQSFLNWAQSNWPWLAAGGAAFVLLKEL